MHLLGLDVGTTGCKALVIDEEGTVKGTAYRGYGIKTNSSGKAEQNAEDVWESVLLVMAEAASKSKAQNDISALSLSVQGDALIPVDKNGNALSNAILGMDYRSEGCADMCAEQFGDYNLYEKTGMRPHPMNFLTKILFLRTVDKNIFTKAFRFVTYADFLLRKMGVSDIIDNTMASRTMAYSIQHHNWAYDILSILEIPSEKLSKVVPSGTAVGTLNPSIAAQAGISSEVIIVTGGHDQTCAALGAGVIDTGTGVISTGTAEVYSRIYSEAPLNENMFDGYYPAYEYHVAGHYFTFSLNHTGGLLLKWFCDEYCTEYKEEAFKKGSSLYSRLDSMCSSQPTDIFFLPHLNGSGTPWCDMKSKGAIIGLKLSTGRIDIYKAIMESLTYELAINIELLENRFNPVKELVAVGGGAASDIWMQIKADILDRPISRTSIGEAACLGAALLAGTGVKVFTDLREATGTCVKKAKIFYPRKKYGTIYKGKLKIFKELYPLLLSVNKRL